MVSNKPLQVNVGQEEMPIKHIKKTAHLNSASLRNSLSVIEMIRMRAVEINRLSLFTAHKRI